MHIAFRQRAIYGLLTVGIVCILAFPASAQLAGATTCGPHANTPPSSVNLSDQGDKIREAIRCLINAERSANGLNPLWLSPELTRAAHGHATEAGRLRWWDGEYESKTNPLTGEEMTYDTHVNPETNTTPPLRIAASEYCARRPSRTGEITYTGTGASNECLSNACSTPAAAVNWWVNISTFGHRQRVLDPDVREIGVGLSGKGADPRIPLGGDMGTYVVNFGNCPTFVPPPPPPPPETTQPSPRLVVRFQKLHINDCPEIGICDWKLTCNLAGQPPVELIGMIEKNTGGDIDLGSAPTLTQNGTLPVDLTCRVSERDGPGIFDSAVWEHVGTVTTSLDAGNREIRINQNRSEGDVTLHVLAEALASTSSPLVSTPLPAAPRNCRIPAASSPPRCGNISIECDRPLPYFEIVVSGAGGGGIPIYMTNREMGLLSGNYLSEGTYSLAVCARNAAGASCGNAFSVALGSLTAGCYGPPPPPPQCAPGFYRCPMRGCIPTGYPCFPQR